MTLHTRLLPHPPRPGRPRLVMVHGFTQNTECWGVFADRLADDFDLVLVDAPGHGRSGHDDADLAEAGALIGDVGGRAHYLGYSMGGRMLLHLAVERPELMQSLTLIGATAGIDDPTERAERRAADDALADRLLAEGLVRFLDRWLDLPLFAGLDRAAANREARETNRPDGLAASLRNCGTGTQEPLWGRLADLDVPTLLVAGSEDHKFTALAARLEQALPQAERASVPGGHPIHAEQPADVAELVKSFVRSHAEA